MFEKLEKFFKAKKKEHEQRQKKYYDLKLDNVAIPEVRTGKEEKPEEKPDHSPISYENVAIPEVHIRSKKKKNDN